jgi:hypothetical protein
MRPLPRLVSTSIALVVASAPSLVAASPTYPADIKTDLSLTYDLGTTHCTICHATNVGGVGTVIQPFGKAMRAAGLTLENPPALQAALTMLDTDKNDSDCNGIPDIEQIKAGRDPNTGAYIDGSGRIAPAEPGCGADAGTSGAGSPPPLVYGCGARIAPVPVTPFWQGAAAVVAGLWLVLARRHR